MKKLTVKLTVFLLLLCLVVLPVFASGEYVRDNAGLLTDDQVRTLEDTACTFSEKHGFGIYIHTVYDFNGRDIFDYAVADYKSNGLGAGSQVQGAMLTLSMYERDYCFLFNGPIGDKAFTETGRDDLERAVLPYLRNNDYYGAFMKYLTVCDEYLTAYENGKPVGSGTDHSQTGYVEYSEDNSGMKTLLSAIPGAFAALIAGVGASAPMRSAKRKLDAAGYGNGLTMTSNRDQFLHRSVTRTPKPQNTGGGGHSGGGSFHHSSGSFSGRSGKF